jgi:hypothetical protein
MWHFIVGITLLPKKKKNPVLIYFFKNPKNIHTPLMQNAAIEMHVYYI